MDEQLVNSSRKESLEERFYRWHFCNSLPPLDRISDYPDTVFCKWLDCCAFCYTKECNKCDCICDKSAELMCCCFTIIFI